MQYINLEGSGFKITFTNIGDLEEFDFNLEELNEESDIEAAFESLDEYAQSSEIDLTCDVKSLVVLNPEELKFISIESEESTKELTLDDFKLKNIPLNDIDKLIESAEIGDLLYLRVESGDISYRVEVNNNLDLEIGYFDCSNELNSYDLLAKDYYSNICDTILPETLLKFGTLDEFKFEPNIIYAKLFKVVYNEELNSKVLKKLEAPAYYFLDETKSIDEA